jgi:salicylate hydroxylase
MQVGGHAGTRPVDLEAAQRGARQDGLRLDSTATDLSTRDAELAAHAEFRKRFYAYDVVPHATAAAAALL